MYITYIYTHIYILHKYTYKGYQQQPIAITQCFMGWTQSSDGSTIQYLFVLKTKIHES